MLDGRVGAIAGFCSLYIKQHDVSKETAMNDDGLKR